MEFSLELRGFDELIAALGASIDPALKEITFAVGELVRSEIAVYPGPAHRPVIWASDKSRRYYFAMRRRAGLPLAYTRNSDPMSQRLGPSWTVAHLGQTDAVVANKAQYGPFVQAAQYQTAQHKATGWITDERAIQNVERSGDVERVAERVFAAQTVFKD